jgi:hypothetical protein
MSKLSFANYGKFNIRNDIKGQFNLIEQQIVTESGVSDLTYGNSMTMSTDGLWVAIGFPFDTKVYIYKRSSVYNNFTFSSLISKPGRTGFGETIDINRNGTYMIIGENISSILISITYIYSRNITNDKWTQRFTVQSPNGPLDGSSYNIGRGVAIDNDGNYALIKFSVFNNITSDHLILKKDYGTENWTLGTSIVTGSSSSDSFGNCKISKNANYTFTTSVNDTPITKKITELTYSAFDSTTSTSNNIGRGLDINEAGTITVSGIPNINSQIGQIRTGERNATNFAFTDIDPHPSIDVVPTERFGTATTLSSSGNRLFILSRASEETNSGRLWVYDRVNTIWKFRGVFNNDIVTDLGFVDNLGGVTGGVSAFECDDRGENIIFGSNSVSQWYSYRIENVIQIQDSIKANSLRLNNDIEREITLYPHYNTSSHNLILPPFNKKGYLINDREGNLNWNDVNQLLNTSNTAHFFQIGITPSILIPNTNNSLMLSLRKLNVNYNGFCIEVRRTIDDALMKIGFTNNNCLDISSLNKFLNGNLGYVKTWYDQSGNNNDFEQTTNANQPRIELKGINNYPSILFDGTDDFLDGGDILDIETNVGWFVNVVGLSNLNNGTFISKELNTTSTNRWSLRYGSTTFDSIFHDSVETSISTSRTANSSPEIISLNIDRNNAVKSLDVFINNSLFASTTITENDTYDHSSATRCLIGARSDATDIGELDYLDGQINEIIIRNVVTTNIERQGIEQNQANNYEMVITEISKVIISIDNTISSDYSIKLPNVQGNTNNTLINDGSGNLSWIGSTTENIFNETTTSLTLNTSHETILCSNGSGCIVTLPDANTFIGKKYKIVNFNATGTITINRSGGDTINNAQTSISLASQHDKTFILSVGNNQWYTF